MSEEVQPFPFCVPVVLPSAQAELDALEHAIEQNPANIPSMAVSPAHMAVLKSSYWGAKGVDLGVSFLEPVTNTFKRMLFEHANIWGKMANVKFRDSQHGEVRIAFKRGDGYWSYMGTDILSIPTNKPTMNLDSFTERTPESEWKRVVRHEFGHTLGFPHEHMRQEIVNRIDPQKAYKYFAKRVGWNANMVDSQVLTSLEAKKIISNKARTDSIMCYQFPGEIMKDGQPVPGGNDLTVQDHELARKLYPQWN